MATVFALAFLLLLLNFRQNTHFERVLISGLSGVFLSLLVIGMLVFALPHARRDSLICTCWILDRTHISKTSLFSGLSGVFLSFLVIVIFVFALPYARRFLFSGFQTTHKLYLPLYILLVIHGSAQMVQDPHFPYFIIGPAVLFVIDKLISYNRTTLELTVLKAELLPSG